jgi:hypothetical protein
MKFNLSVTAIILLVVPVFTSCQKEIAVDDLPGAGSVKLRTYIEDARNTPYNAIDTFNVSYDGDGRIVSLISVSSGAKFLYQYNPDNYVFDIKSQDHLIIRDVSYINGAGLVDSTFQYNDTEDSSTMKLLYNAARQVTEEREYDFSMLTGAVLQGINSYVYDNNGNVTEYTEKTASGQIISVTSYTYNNFLNTIFLVPGYRPLPYKNLPVTKSIYYPGGGTESSTTEYTFDNDSRVISEKETDSYGNFVIKKYLYN